MFLINYIQELRVYRYKKEFFVKDYLFLKKIVVHLLKEGYFSSEKIKDEIEKATTPKFERAKAVYKNETLAIYISGTAAISGELSINDKDIEQQTYITIENIEELISKENLIQ